MTKIMAVRFLWGVPFVVLGVIFGWLAVPTVQAQEASAGATIRAEITAVDQTTVDGQPRVVYHLKLLEGPQRGSTVTSGENGGAVLVNGVIFKAGDRVFVATIERFDGTTSYVVQDLDRQASLWWLVALFVLVIVWFSRWHGVRSLVGLVFSFAVIVSWMVPQIGAGSNPMVIALFGSAAVLVVGFLVTEGVNRFSVAAIVGTVTTLAVTGFIAWWSIGLTRLTGNSSEEAFFLQSAGSATIDLRGLLFAGMLIGTLGILDDLAVSQVAAIAELRVANPKLSRWALYAAAMRVGRSHLGAIINTLVLAYAGSALPLLLLFHYGNQPANQIINGELVSAEIVRAIVGSIGLVLALPITTICATLFKVRRTSGHIHNHTEGDMATLNEPQTLKGG